MSRRTVSLGRVIAISVFAVAACSASFQAASAQPGIAFGTGTAATQYNPCGSNSYGCYQPYGACDSYQPGCAGAQDPGYKPYDYEQNKPYYSGSYR
ncbi:hypothetical protein [Nocardia sp. BMG51109]|uniref:hypothetical protein n=1 Tax=Nocardia sp. BMG51109 TaxID=1056816 RepID=UPI0004664A43|nr:hypothetical protein [Nocardia sp. BMG51109]